MSAESAFEIKDRTARREERETGAVRSARIVRVAKISARGVPVQRLGVRAQKVCYTCLCAGCGENKAARPPTLPCR